MKANQSEHLRRSKEFEAAQNRLRANQIETMIAAFDRMCIDLGHQIEAEETACSDLRSDAFRVSNICEGGPRAPRQASAVNRCPQD